MVYSFQRFAEKTRRRRDSDVFSGVFRKRQWWHTAPCTQHSATQRHFLSLTAETNRLHNNTVYAPEPRLPPFNFKPDVNRASAACMVPGGNTETSLDVGCRREHDHTRCLPFLGHCKPMTQKKCMCLNSMTLAATSSLIGTTNHSAYRQSNIFNSASYSSMRRNCAFRRALMSSSVTSTASRRMLA